MLSRVALFVAIGFFAGIPAGMMMGRYIQSAPSSSASVSSSVAAASRQHATPEPTPDCNGGLRYKRERVPFFGHLNLDWLHQWDCVPVPMRYQFTLNGTVGVDHHPPTTEGRPLVDDDVERPGFPFAPGQVYYKLRNNPELFGLRRGNRPVWSKKLLEFLISEVAQGQDISCEDYPESATDVALALRVVGVADRPRLFVGGSISPWVEAVALHAGVQHVVTADYLVPFCDHCHARLETVQMEVAMQRKTPADYDLIISYSSIEHDGLGRYGDPIDPYGDFHAMKEFHALLKVGGLLLLSVPMWPRDMQSQMLARLYGPIRLPMLIKGWEYLGTVNKGAWSKHVPFFEHWGWQPILILRKVENPTSELCTLDCSNSALYDNSCRPAANCNLHVPTELHIPIEGLVEHYAGKWKREKI